MYIETLNYETGEYLEKIPDTSEGSFSIVLVEPSRPILLQIEKKLGIPWEELQDALDIDERPYIEIDDDLEIYKIVLRVPSDITHAERLFPTIPLIIILYKRLIIRMFNKPYFSPKIEKFHLRETYSDSKVILFDYLDLLIKSFESALDMLERTIESFEEHIFKTTRVELTESIYKISKDAIFLDAALKSNMRVFNRLPKMKLFCDDEDALEYIEDLQIDLDQQNQLVNIYRQLIDSSIDAIQTRLDASQNDLIKVLASISFLLMIPTLIASVFGMNIPLPFQEESYALVITLLISFFLIIPFFLYFRYKGWSLF